MKPQALQNLSGQLRVIALDIAAGAARDTDAETVALAALVLDDHARVMASAELPPLPVKAPPAAAKPDRLKAASKRAPKGQGEHRHKFGADGSCGCGAKRQRAAKGTAAALPDAEARTVPLPMPMVNSRPLLGDHAPDDFDGGAFGSSSSQDRR